MRLSNEIIKNKTENLRSSKRLLSLAGQKTRQSKGLFHDTTRISYKYKLIHTHFGIFQKLLTRVHH